MTLEEMIDLIDETLELTEAITIASPAITALAKAFKTAGVKVAVEPWKDGSLGVSMKHDQMKYLDGFDALEALNGVTGFKRKILKGSFTFKGNEYLFQPYKGHLFIMVLTD